MSGSILRCSGAHWLRITAAWAVLVAALFHLQSGKAQDGSVGRTVVAGAGAHALLAAPPYALIDAEATVAQSIMPFDFNAVPAETFGDAESAEPVVRYR